MSNGEADRLVDTHAPEKSQVARQVMRSWPVLAIAAVAALAALAPFPANVAGVFVAVGVARRL
jgi:hypothetical protein